MGCDVLGQTFCAYGSGRLYGHRDKGRALDRIVGAYTDAASDP
jgi:hypothetical protein